MKLFDPKSKNADPQGQGASLTLRAKEEVVMWTFTQQQKLLALFSLVIVALLVTVHPLYAQTVTTTVPVGQLPYGVAANEVTNKIYVANRNSNNVTVIDGATNSTATVSVGYYPTSVAANPLTNKIYVTNGHSGSVTVIDGATNLTTTIGAGTNPNRVAVNPLRRI
jgi:YVTN family beta-propeller protein